MDPEREFLGRKKAKLWTYLIFGTVLALGILLANFAVVNPALARRGVDYVLGLPAGAFPVIAGVVGALIYVLGLKIETDWPEALGALLIAGAVASGRVPDRLGSLRRRGAGGDALRDPAPHVPGPPDGGDAQEPIGC